MERCTLNPHPRVLLGICLLLMWGSWQSSATGQEPINVLPAPGGPPIVSGQPISAPAGPLSLDACIQMGNQQQPALAAAQASLSAAHSGQRGINGIRIPRFLAPDLGVRREQACVGVTIASAGLQQAEWNTRYAITRNFFTVQYIRMQKDAVDDVLSNLDKARARAKKIFDKGIVDGKITQLDLDAIDIQIALVKTKKSQIDNGMLKAYAALREAIGVAPDYELNIEQAPLPSLGYQFDKKQLIASALANRADMIQAQAANRVTELEISAQQLARGFKVNTFAAGADIHSRPIPQGIFNNEYRPDAIGPEMPDLIVGRKCDRVQRASDLNQRSVAVVDKTTNLVALDVEAQYLKWQEAVEQIQSLQSIQKVAADLPKSVLAREPTDFTSFAVIQANTTAVSVRT